MVQIVGFPDADRVLIERAVDEVWRRLRTADVPEPLRLQLLALFDKGGKLRLEDGREEGSEDR